MTNITLSAELGRSARKHRAILDAGRDLFLRHGYLATNMDGVAAASRVSKQTVYKHFTSKEALFIEVVGELTTSTGDRVHDAVTDLVDRDGVAAFLEQYANRQLTAVLDPQVLRLRRLVIGEVGRFPALGRELWEKGPQRAIAAFAVAIGELDGRGLLDVDDPRLAAERFNWLVMGEPLNRAMLLGESDTRNASELAAHSRSAVSAFLAIYAPPSQRGDPAADASARAESS